MNRDNTEVSRGVYDEKREKLRAMQEKRVQAAKEKNYAQYSRIGERMTGYQRKSSKRDIATEGERARKKHGKGSRSCISMNLQKEGHFQSQHEQLLT